MTLGQHLKKKRFLEGLRQPEAARKLEVSNRTLSLWETDKVYPPWAFQPRSAAYLGYDPFIDPALERPLGNETAGVTILSSESPLTLGQKKLHKRRLELHKTRTGLAKELGISIKTLRSWETDALCPCPSLQAVIVGFLGLDM
jgi:DNA-binding XRE family transcriptional regulator